MTPTDPNPQPIALTDSRIPRPFRALFIVLLALAATLPVLLAGTSGSAHAAVTVRAAAAAPGQCMSVAVTQKFGNGVIPAAALCPITGAPGQLLRTDAAKAFNRMSAAYAERFGSRICVTDSYRTLTEQKALFTSKPKLAAKPGTSNHGWGTATDLCGGAERYTTKKHRWLVANAAQYGWSNPFWARRGGGREEPWHWEYNDSTVASRVR